MTSENRSTEVIYSRARCSWCEEEVSEHVDLSTMTTIQPVCITCLKLYAWEGRAWTAYTRYFEATYKWWLPTDPPLCLTYAKIALENNQEEYWGVCLLPVNHERGHVFIDERRYRGSMTDFRGQCGSCRFFRPGTDAFNSRMGYGRCEHPFIGPLGSYGMNNPHLSGVDPNAEVQGAPAVVFLDAGYTDTGERPRLAPTVHFGCRLWEPPVTDEGDTSLLEKPEISDRPGSRQVTGGY